MEPSQMIAASLKLMRWPNLVIVALVQVTFYFRHLVPLLSENGIERNFDNWHVALFILTSILVTGAGNVINDIVDVVTDEINKPDKMIIGRSMSEEGAINLYGILTLSGAILAAYLTWYNGGAIWFLLYPLIVVILWVYSKFLKGIPFIGNLTISLLCVAVFIIILLLELNGIGELRSVSLLDYERLIKVVGGFGFLAMLITINREIVKDSEDVEGDSEAGYTTLPTEIGLKATSYIIRFLMLIFVLAVFYWLFAVYGRTVDWLICLPGFILPVLLMILVLNKYDESEIYTKVSRTLKLLMLVAIIYLYLV
jgi:4-hydroxybenzoate polyprenyltransferase